MRKIWIIACKELALYFRSPLAYVLLIIVVSVFNVFFYLIIDHNREATLTDVFLLMEFMFVFLIPLLTMKLFSEEKASGTMEFLMTSPTPNTAIVLGKYLGSLILYSLVILSTVVYYALIEYYGTPDSLAILGGYIGIWLEGAMFIAVGMLASSWCKSQTLSAITSYIILFILYFSLAFVDYAAGPAQTLITNFSTMSHFSNFAAGLIVLESVVYYLSLIFLCIMLTRISIESQLWQ